MLKKGKVGAGACVLMGGVMAAGAAHGFTLAESAETVSGQMPSFFKAAAAGTIKSTTTLPKGINAKVFVKESPTSEYYIQQDAVIPLTTADTGACVPRCKFEKLQ